jgi:hypothetical protein
MYLILHFVKGNATRLKQFRVLHVVTKILEWLHEYKKYKTLM